MNARRADRLRRGSARKALLLGLIPVALIAAAVVATISAGRGPADPDPVAAPDDDAPQSADLFASMTIPEFRALDQSGTARDRSIFTTPGRHTVLNFVFTRCITVCPITTGQMVRVQSAIKDLPRAPGAGAGEKFQIVSFSVDPTRDTPEAMKAHAEPFADFSVWTFLTADAPTVQAVVEKGLGFALEEDRSAPIDLGNGESMSNIVHTSKVLLISPEGKVVAMYRGLDETDIDRLIKRIERMNQAR